MARWRSRAIDAAIVGGLALSFGFAARRRGNSLARILGAGFTAAAWARFAAYEKPGAATEASPGMNASSTLVSIVAHEIRAPLASIRGAVALLDEHDATLEKSRRVELLHVAL